MRADGRLDSQAALAQARASDPERALERPAPWVRASGAEVMLSRWSDDRDLSACFTAQQHLPARSGQWLPPPNGLDPRLLAALRKRGIDKLYAHQHHAVQASLAGQHVVVSTPTASGKSLCLQLPVLQALAEQAEGAALYLYPTKALSRDQEQGLLRFLSDAKLAAPAVVYDGDTPADARRAAREQCRILLTNPDMLHASILPNHTRWARLLQNLRYVVLDELHTYRGVFGSHLAHVIARLKRLARFHGASPRFITATATIGNPREHAARLLGVPEERLSLVTESGAPHAEREVRVYNPPVVNAELGIRGSSLKHGVKLAVDLVRAGVSTLVFAHSRNSVEVMLKYIRERARGVPDDAIFGYRGGYLPDKRRAIERRLRAGEIRCVVATNALELGIDIGELDAVICVGYPGSVASTWQRFGRAGRRDRRSLAVLVCSNTPTDQFVASNPESVLQRGAEEARIDPENIEILVQHLKCAAYEHPFRLASAPDVEVEPYAHLDMETTRDALDYLADQGLLHRGAGQYTWIGETAPAPHVSLRSISWDNFVIIDQGTGQALAELDFRSAHTMLHVQAIYQHDAAQYQVERLDYENHKAFVRRVEPDYFTTALTSSRVSILDVDRERTLRQGTLAHGDIQVLESVTGYKKVKFVTHENTGYGDVHLPDLQMHTTGVWWQLPPRLLRADSVTRALLIDGFRGAGAALETVATWALMCEPQDLSRTLAEGEPSDQAARPPETKRDRGDGMAEPPEPELEADDRYAQAPEKAPPPQNQAPPPESQAPKKEMERQQSRPAPHVRPPQPEGSACSDESAASREARATPPSDREESRLETRQPGDSASLYEPTLYLYDAQPGGVGLARRLFERAETLFERAATLIERCECKHGCPACVGAQTVRSDRKRLAVKLLRGEA